MLLPYENKQITPRNHRLPATIRRRRKQALQNWRLDSSAIQWVNTALSVFRGCYCNGDCVTNVIKSDQREKVDGGAANEARASRELQELKRCAKSEIWDHSMTLEALSEHTAVEITRSL
uniref:Uncharacterized protein n=1 Tax=Steinernema glaseri TaxID=37863 RepID=A0A1I8AHA3_9BILA